MRSTVDFKQLLGAFFCSGNFQKATLRQAFRRKYWGSYLCQFSLSHAYPILKLLSKPRLIISNLKMFRFMRVDGDDWIYVSISSRQNIPVPGFQNVSTKHRRAPFRLQAAATCLLVLQIPFSSRGMNNTIIVASKDLLMRYRHRWPGHQ